MTAMTKRQCSTCGRPDCYRTRDASLHLGHRPSWTERYDLALECRDLGIERLRAEIEDTWHVAYDAGWRDAVKHSGDADQRDSLGALFRWRREDDR